MMIKCEQIMVPYDAHRRGEQEVPEWWAKLHDARRSMSVQRVDRVNNTAGGHDIFEVTFVGVA